MSVPGHTMLVAALQMALGNDTTLSHAVSHVCSMSDQSVTFISARKNTRTEEAALTYYPRHMASKELPLKKPRRSFSSLQQRHFLIFQEHKTETHDGEVFLALGCVFGLVYTLPSVS